ncbi:MAG: hypothetical protein R3F43_03835 [bacterium]
MARSGGSTEAMRSSQAAASFHRPDTEASAVAACRAGACSGSHCSASWSWSIASARMAGRSACNTGTESSSSSSWRRRCSSRLAVVAPR